MNGFIGVSNSLRRQMTSSSPPAGSCSELPTEKDDRPGVMGVGGIQVYQEKGVGNRATTW